MKTTKTVLILVIALAGFMLADSAFAWYRGGPRVSVGIGFGFPYAGYGYGYGYGYPYYAPYSYYPPYYAAPVVVQQQQPVYVEQPAPQVQPQQPAGYWYYCNDSRAYYPYVRECPAGWQKVAPQPG